MKINNISEFFHFIKNSGLSNMHPEVSSFIKCMEEYGRMCQCDPTAARTSKINQCKNLYINFISHSSDFKNQLLTKISDNTLDFWIDGRHVITISR